MKITVISDLHGYEPVLPGGDILIIAGDCTARNTSICWGIFFKWLKEQEYTHKIIVGGNHDAFLEENFVGVEDNSSEIEDFTYLCDTTVEIEGIKIYGAPWTPWFYGVNKFCTAFMLHPRELEEKWELIPKDTDILVTHTPPKGIMDCIIDNYRVQNVGCFHLLKKIIEIKPKYHIFGHIHESAGTGEMYGVKFINAACLDRNYEPWGTPIKEFEI